jgi:hypothetical protein
VSPKAGLNVVILVKESLATFEDGIEPDKSVASNLPPVVMLLAKLLLIEPIYRSYIAKYRIVISAAAVGAVENVNVVPDIV